MGNIFGLMGVGGGLYCLYAYYLMRTKGKLNTNIMLPKGIDEKICKDQAAYIKKISLPLLVLSIVLTAYGVVELINVYVVNIQKLIYAAIVVVLVTLIWFTAVTKKYNKEYFGI